MVEEAQHEIRPSQALLSPAWLLALTVLIANDHWLKHADLLPEFVTGKLSDVAGMIVAPALMAALLGVRRKAALAWCHVAVGSVFAAIQLSPLCAESWSAAMGLFGYPWTITRDWTDLLALPVLLLSWRMLTPLMEPTRSHLGVLRRTAVASLAGLGLWSSLATTQEEPEPWYPPIWGQLYINNLNEFDLALHFRYLRDDLELDCDAVAEDPGRVLSPDAFGEAEHWLLPPHTNAPILINEDGRACAAIWVAGEGIDPTILFFDPNWDNDNFHPGYEEDPSFATSGPALGLSFAADGRASWLGGEDIRFVPRSDAPEQPPGCEPSSLEQRIVWDPGLPEYAVEVVSLEPGLDGCFEFELRDWTFYGMFPEPVGTEPYPWYLCAPNAAVPFVAGSFVEIVQQTSMIGTSELTMTLLDPTSLGPMLDDNGNELLIVRLLHGGNDPQFIGPAINREVVATPADSCPWTIEPGCATAERATNLAVGENTLAIADPVAFADGSRVRTMVVSYVRERAVLDGECASGAMVLAYDIDLAVIYEPLL